MNVERIMQIVRELVEIPDQQLMFGSLYRKTSGNRWEEKGESFSPLGYHIHKHPELKQLLDVNLKTDEYKRIPTVSEMLKSKGPFTIRTGWWVVDSKKLKEYLGLGDEHIDCIFYNSRFTRHQFVDTVTAFAKGELDIRECHRDECGIVFTTDTDDKACVCPECKEDLMAMCGL